MSDCIIIKTDKGYEVIDLNTPVELPKIFKANVIKSPSDAKQDNSSINNA